MAKQKQAENSLGNAEDIMSEMNDIFSINQLKRGMSEDE